ncbi:GMC oxidoreductase [Desarmillaria tabescens]|uniref:GMC oxidoreductase n=1 Tax=Armillaria tabescens TaxID=1929756 RepID=A0AA39KFU1_ARMTA|nr:GMC oxidoreductase [Desarmillaria tabescens]KAK0460401.1 GMC oxidoreductase [Desarmillaria tabescens]
MGGFHSKNTTADLASVAFQVDSDEYEQWKSYDYVVVGGGTAGCVLASRLSEDPSTTVCLIEAGKTHESDFLTSIPLAFSKLFKTGVDWDYETVPQEALGSRRIYWPRGKILGGTSAINCLIYHRCAPEDFDEWQRLGAEGWSYKDLLPYFRKAETFNPDRRRPDVKISDHGVTGPWQTGPQHFPPAPIHEVLVETCKALNIPFISDTSSESGTLGSTEFVSCTDKNGKRSSSATAYLPPSVLARPNLTVATHTMVEKVLLDTSATTTPRAIGLELSSVPGGPYFRVRATREVVLCAGAVGTPQILMLSGVGPRDSLEKLDIPVIKDHPAVGQHLLDHPSCGTVLFRTKASNNLTWDYVGSPLVGAWALIRWLFTGKGPMSGVSFPGGAFVRSDDPSLRNTGSPVRDNTSGPNAPDIEIIWMPLLVLEGGTKRPPKGVTGVSMGAMVMRPLSEGSISLKTASIWNKPLIDPKYLSNENDMNVLLRGVRLILRMARSEPFCSNIDWSKSDGSMPWLYPGNADPDEISDEVLRAWISENGMGTWHPVSSARMGKDIASSVVDANLKVHGIDGLRVVDASVFPNQVSGHPCAVVIAVAEKAADIIKAA